MTHFPTIKQLRYFIALVEFNHFGKAAEHSYVSQSAFSVAIKELENSLGGQLVDRTNKQVTITNLGRDVYQQARAVMLEMTKMVDIAHGSMEPLTGHLALGIIPTIAPFVLPTFVPAIKQSFAKLELEIHEGMTREIYETLMSGELDVILIALPFELRGVEYKQLYRDHFKLISHRHSDLFIQSESFDIDKMKDESILLLEDGHCLRDHTLSACHIKNIDKVSKVSASSLLTLVEMVLNATGVSFMPEMALASPLLQRPELRISDMGPDSYRDIGLVWRKGSTRVRDFELLAQQMKPKTLQI